MMTDTPWHLKNYKNSLNSRLRLVPVVEEVLIREQLNSTRDTEHLHPSEICKRDWCPRSSWYTIKGYEKVERPLTFQTLNVFAEGHAIHNKWQTWLQEAGVLEEVELPISNEEYMLLGHADGLINDKKGKAILEIKSVGAGTIRMEDPDIFLNSATPDEMWKKVRQPFMTHLRQVNLYMFATGIHEAVFIYEWKATQEVKEFSVKYQPHLIEGILAGCKAVIRGIESGIPPMRPSWIEDSSHKVCKSCPYRNVCWKENDDTSTSSQSINDGGVSL